MATIQGVYVALFGRPADPTGLAYFNGVTNNGANLSAINNLAGQKEYTDRFAGQNNVQIVNSIYQSLFGRDAEAGGLNFFVDALNKGTLNINNIAIAILDGAQGSDKTIADNKVAAANLFTAALDTPTEIGSYTGNGAAAIARGWLAGVTTTAATQASADAAIKAVVDGGAAGKTISVASTVEVGPTAALADNQTTANNDTVNVNATGAVTSVAKVDGGFGTDTVNLKAVGGNAVGAANGAAATVGATGAANHVAAEYTNVEKLFLTATGGNDDGAAGAGVGGAAGLFIDVSKAPALKEIWNNGSVVGVANGGAAGASAVELSNVALTTAVGFQGAITGTTAVAYKDAGGSSDAATIAFNGATLATAGNTNINGIEVFNISNTGTSDVKFTGDAAAKTVNVTGDGSLALTIATSAVETVAASAFTGNLNFATTAALKSYVGGTGLDTVTVSTAHAANLTVDGGAGADTLTVVYNVGATDFTVNLTGGAGADSFVIGAAAQSIENVKDASTNAALLKSLVTITDFDKAVDAIKIGDGGAVNTKFAFTDADIATIKAQTTLLDAANKAVELIALSGATQDKLGIFNFGTDAYAIVESAGNGFGAGDTLVKITGATAADFTATNFLVL